MATGGTENVGATGATLSATFSGATGNINRVGFYYGTSSSSLTSSITAVGTTSPFSTVLSGLTAGTTYYYQAYVSEYNASTASYQERKGSVKNFTTKQVATGSVTTNAATGVSTVGATLNASFSGVTGAIGEMGFLWGTSSSNLNNEAYVDPQTGASGTFQKALTSLNEGTTYYYKAFIAEYDESLGSYSYKYGAVKSFTTSTSGSTQGSGLQYLTCYEMPAINLASQSGYSDKGTETNGKWWNYATTNSKQKVVTHTFTDGKQYRNFTALIDGTKKAPLWSAFVMHSDVYYDDGVGRSGSWHTDPGIPEDWQQTGVSGYSRGHFVASNYRQSCSDANKQTFFYTNQAPQYQTGFNDGVWNQLEQAVKANAPSGRDTLYVVVGVLYETSQTSEGVPVPSHFYKLLMKCSFNTSGTMTAANGVAYLFTNEAHNGMKYAEAATTIDAIEQRSGFDFFTNVPKTFQDAAEAMSSGLW